MEANKEWCAQTCTRRREAKLYLKTIYRDNCKAKDQCPDHCTAFALSNPADADYRTDCSHDYNTSCNDGEALKKAIQEIHSAIEKYSSKINNREKDDLRHDAPVAEEKVKEWKAHMHAHNQEKCKQSILLSLLEDEDEVFTNKVSRKAIRVVSKERRKLVFMQCHCQERREARSLLLRAPVEQLWPGLVRCSLNPRATHDCHKNKPSNH